MGVVEPDSEAVAARPVGPLARYVVGHHGYRQRGIEPAQHLGMPSPYLTVIFTLDEPVDVRRHPDPNQPAGTFTTLVGGLHSSPALIAHPGAQSGIQLLVSPLAARPLLGLPAGELASIDVSGDQIWGRVAGRVQERLHAARDWPSRFAVLDTELSALLNDRRDPKDGLARAWSRLLASGGTIPIRDLADESGCSERHLNTLFRREIGLSPKRAARVIRFDRARRRLERQVVAGRPRIADIAAGSGYFDQAHLNRDWQQFTGLAPTEWIAHEFRNFQATAGREPASSTA